MRKNTLGVSIACFILFACFSNGYGRSVTVEEAPLLIERIKTGAMSDSSVKDLVAFALCRQADRTAAWTRVWGDVIEAAGKVGLLSRDQWIQYVDQMYAPLLLTIRDPVRIGDPLVIELRLSDERKGNHELVGFFGVKSLSIDGDHVGIPSGGPSGCPLSGINPRGGRSHVRFSGSIPSHTLSKLALARGKHAVTYRAAIKARPPWTTANDMAITTTITLTREIMFVGPEEQTVTLIWDKSMAEAVRNSIRIENLCLSPVRMGPGPIADSPLVNSKADLIVGPAPVDLAYSVYLRQGRKARLLDQFHMRAGNSLKMYLSAQLWELKDAPVDVILQPSRKEAAGTLTINRILGDEIIIRNVPVKWAIEENKSLATHRGEPLGVAD